MPNSTNVQDLYRLEGDDLFKRLYHEERISFIAWSKKNYGAGEEDAVEAFQESMVILYQKIRTQELVEIQSTLKTYLFAIGRNVLLKKYELNKKKQNIESLPEVSINPLEEQGELTDSQLKLKLAMEQLGHSCRDVLWLFYYRNFTIESIANHLNFNSEEVVRSKKYKCLKQLRKILNTKNV